MFLGPVMITLFTRAIYEDDVELPAEGFLHPALFTDDLDSELEGHTVVWGPEIVEGTFGRRRIAFVSAPGGIRLEFMEQLDPPPPPPRDLEPTVGQRLRNRSGLFRRFYCWFRSAAGHASVGPALPCGVFSFRELAKLSATADNPIDRYCL